MKKAIICGSIVIVLGLFIALGSQFLFKVCDTKIMSSELTNDTCGESDDSGCGCSGGSVTTYPICHWSAQAEIGMGLLIAALGACMIVFTDQKTHLGLLIGIFFSSIIALAIPNMLIGGCSMMTMQCRKVAFPALTIESVVLLVFSVIMITVTAIQKPPAETV